MAFDSGLSLPPGPMAVLNPALTERLDLPAPVRVVTWHHPVHAALFARGIACGADIPAGVASVLVCLPRARDEAQDLIARAAACGAGLVIVDGQKTDGIESMLKALRARVTLSEPLSKAHGKIAWFAPVPLDDWRAPARRVDTDLGAMTTAPGVFSADGPDPASVLLADAVRGLTGVVADLGAGWGYLAARLLAANPGIRELHLVESDARALDCARANVTDPRARFHWADATDPPAIRADAVVMNPPFHRGRAVDPALGAAFVRGAARILTPQGRLWMVANRHLPYETVLDACFATHEELAGTPGFKLLLAAKPRPARQKPVAGQGAGRGRVRGRAT
jgi:16S rRNA (guanine1207-N2)-methyltransferase